MLNIKNMKIKKIFALAIFVLFVFESCDKKVCGDCTPILEKNTFNVAYGSDPLQKMDIYLPENRNTATTKVIILIHGGAWISGDKSEFTAVDIDTLKKRLPNYAIFNLNYRLAALPSTNPFPAQEIDVRAAIEYIYGNRSTYLISDKFVIMGGSAGGHLALLHAYKYQSVVKIKAVVDFFGPTDMVDMYNNPGTFTPGSIALLLSGTPTSNPTMYNQSSPITYATATACPTIILQGGLDPLVNPTTQSLALKNKLTTAGIINQYVFYPLMGHGNWDAPTNIDAFNKIQAFLTANVQ